MPAVSHIFRDKKLRAIRIWPGIRVGQPSRTIEEQVGGNFILKLVSRIARSVARRVAALNHEIRNHPMKNSPIVERHTMLGDSFDRLPVFGPTGESDEVLHSDRSLVGKQGTSHVSDGRLRRRSGLRTRLSPGERTHKKQNWNEEDLTHDCS